MHAGLAVAILPDDAAAEALPPAAAECVPLEDAIVIDEHVIFSRVFQAAQIPLNATDRYTIFVPEDGEIVSPGNSGGIAGMYGFAGLFSAYGIDTRSARTIRSAPHFSQIKGSPPPSPRMPIICGHTRGWDVACMRHMHGVQGLCRTTSYVARTASSSCGRAPPVITSQRCSTLAALPALTRVIRSPRLPVTETSRCLPDP